MVLRRFWAWALLGLWLTGCGRPPSAAPLPVASPTPFLPTPALTLLPPASPTPSVEEVSFDAQRALADVAAQLAFGPRYPGAPGHAQVQTYIQTQLAAWGWTVETQPFTYQAVPVMNIIGRAPGPAGRPIVLLGAHYDTRARSEQSPGLEATPTPGAVDGASGVAILLELARTLDAAALEHEVWLLFFDAEDNGSGGLPGWDWIVGSTYLADNLTVTPEAMVLVDMVGDADQQLYYEGHSDPDLQAELWSLAAGLGFGNYFIPTMRHTMIDDHLPFARRGIPAVDIIDFDYVYWHTVDDTLDKVGLDSLWRVGHVLETWLEQEGQ